ncbi:MAG: C39 family peptidase [Candidatus Doudnabacteria bacterium]|nr:C39 family peptidase [Candidatus Doudnabacteria bacterium]
MKDKHFIIIGIVFVAAAVAAVIFGSDLKPQNLPQPIPYQETETSVLGAETNPSSFPAEVNLAVPFTSQAPHTIWDEEHKEFCEEASVLMTASYIQNQPIPDPDFAEEQLQKIKNWEVINLGYYKDTTASETAQILTEYFGIKKVELASDPSLEQIKQALAQGKLVILPAAGRQLNNPNYRQPGPLYHMLVIKGYTKDGRIITNDPGTRNGADYIFEADVIMNAMHDWNDGDVENGEKIIIVVG